MKLSLNPGIIVFSILVLISLGAVLFTALLNGFSVEMEEVSLAHPEGKPFYGMEITLRDALILLIAQCAFILPLAKLVKFGKRREIEIGMPREILLIILALLIVGLAFEVPNFTQGLKSIDEASHTMTSYFSALMIKTAVLNPSGFPQFLLDMNSRYPTGEFVAALRYGPTTTLGAGVLFLILEPFLGMT